jgi:hypothetical protein
MTHHEAHELPCSFCGRPVNCIGLEGWAAQHVFWCVLCDDQFVSKSAADVRVLRLDGPGRNEVWGLQILSHRAKRWVRDFPKSSWIGTTAVRLDESAAIRLITRMVDAGLVVRR